MVVFPTYDHYRDSRSLKYTDEKDYGNNCTIFWS